MNKINDLFDKEKVAALFQKELMPLYPDFQRIKAMEIIGHKNNIWGTTYHVVIEFQTTFINKNGQEDTLPIFCTAHSSEPRINVYNSLKYLWDAGFSRGNLSIPHALFYNAYYNGTFYRGAEGRNLYQFIRENRREEIKEIVPKAAAWFVKLHGLPTNNTPNFNQENSRIETVFPGIHHIIERIKNDYPQYRDFYEKIYSLLDGNEKAFLASTDKRWLVHGDAHPENIIKMSERKIAVIDFTDLCLSDFARDLGSFLQQIEYMCDRKIKDARFTADVKTLFLDSYLAKMKIKMDSQLQDRINTYYYWTAMRTATFFLVKYGPEAERAEKIINKISAQLNIQI